jgi:hypothetical protein
MRPSAKARTNRHRRLRLARELRQGRLEPLSQRIQQWLGLRLADGPAFVRRSTANRFFDSIQLADPLQHLPCHRRTMRLLQIEEVTPHVRPARRVLDTNILIELIESRIGIGLQRSAKLFQMLRRMLNDSGQERAIDQGMFRQLSAVTSSQMLSCATRIRGMLLCRKSLHWALWVQVGQVHEPAKYFIRISGGNEWRDFVF